MNTNKFTQYAFVLPIILSTLLAQTAIAALHELDDEALSQVSGQALLDINKYDHAGNNFYRIKMNSLVTTNLNIDRLTLYGPNGAGTGSTEHIDISDLSLSGDINGTSDGNLSSARIRNPYVEFAFAGTTTASNSAADREIIGMRFGADNIDGFMSFGDPDRQGNPIGGPNEENGISAFRGYMKTKAITGTVFVKPETRSINVNTTLGVTLLGNLSVNGIAHVPLLDLAKTGDQRIALAISNTAGVILDSSQATQALSGGNAQLSNNGVFTQAHVIADVAATTIGRLQSVDNANYDSFINVGAANCGLNPLCYLAAGAIGAFNPFSPVITIDNTRVSGELTGNDNDPLSLLVNESTQLFHRVETQSSGFFLSMQNRSLSWKNLSPNNTGRLESPTTAGWWMEFLDPVDVGDLVINDYRLPDNVVNGIGDAVNQHIANQPNIDPFSALGSLFVFDVENVSADLVADVASGIPSLGSFNVVDTNIPLNSNSPITNCWNGSVGC